MAALPICHRVLRTPRPAEKPWFYPRNPQSLGERLKQRRLDRGFSQEQLANALGTTSASVSQWERDTALPLARHWGRLAGMLGPDLLRSGTGFPERLRSSRLRRGLDGLTEGEDPLQKPCAANTAYKPAVDVAWASFVVRRECVASPLFSNICDAQGIRHMLCFKRRYRQWWRVRRVRCEREVARKASAAEDHL